MIEFSAAGHNLRLCWTPIDTPKGEVEGDGLRDLNVVGYRNYTGEVHNVLGDGAGFAVPSHQLGRVVRIQPRKFESVYIRDVAEVRPPLDPMPRPLVESGWTSQSSGAERIFSVICG